jgi:hypothetical protein
MSTRATLCAHCSAPFVDRRLLNVHEIRCKMPKVVATRDGQPAHLGAPPRLRQSDIEESASGTS